MFFTVPPLKKKAIQLGITGIVRNEPNGDVYVEAEGAEEQLKPFVHWLWKGPERAVVENVTVMEGECKSYNGFFIKR